MGASTEPPPEDANSWALALHARLADVIRTAAAVDELVARAGDAVRRSVPCRDVTIEVADGAAPVLERPAVRGVRTAVVPMRTASKEVGWILVHDVPEHVQPGVRRVLDAAAVLLAAAVERLRAEARARDEAQRTRAALRRVDDELRPPLATIGLATSTLASKLDRLSVGQRVRLLATIDANLASLRARLDALSGSGRGDVM